MQRSTRKEADMNTYKILQSAGGVSTEPAPALMHQYTHNFPAPGIPAFPRQNASGSAAASDTLPLHPLSLRTLLQKVNKADTAPVILCIGTDRIIGDSLGPLVGTLLQRCGAHDLPVYGTLENTVHALNLHDILPQIKKAHPGRTVVAIDASLGPAAEVGSVFIRPGSLHPGAGVSKRLPAAGDLSITGIAGTEGRQPYLSLQTARLSTIMEMAERIRDCILSLQQ